MLVEHIGNYCSHHHIRAASCSHNLEGESSCCNRSQTRGFCADSSETSSSIRTTHYLRSIKDNKKHTDIYVPNCENTQRNLTDTPNKFSLLKIQVS